MLFLKPQIVSICAIVPHIAAKNIRNKFESVTEFQKIIQGINNPIEEEPTTPPIEIKNDVNNENGAHCFIKKSHIKKK